MPPRSCCRQYPELIKETTAKNLERIYELDKDSWKAKLWPFQFQVCCFSPVSLKSFHVFCNFLLSSFSSQFAVSFKILSNPCLFLIKIPHTAIPLTIMHFFDISLRWRSLVFGIPGFSLIRFNCRCSVGLL